MNDDNQKATMERVWATLDRVTEKLDRLTLSQAETDRIMKENAQKMRESDAKWDKLHADIAKLSENHAETDRIIKENALQMAETDRMMKENARQSKEDHAEWKEREKKSDAKWNKLHTDILRLNNTVGGIGTSNGDFAEEFFYNSLKSSNLEFFGEKFDRIERNQLAGPRSKLDGEYDNILYNGKAICIVEVKYKAKKDLDFSRIFDRLEKFREQYPQYAGHKYYLALAAFAFHKDIEERCTEEGIAIFKPKGDTVAVYDKNLKVF
jgi:hypothetical protein